MRRLRNAFIIFWIALRNPKIAIPSVFRSISDLFSLIMKVANERRPYVTALAIVHPEIEDQEIVSIWAGAGIGADPIKRLAELAKENQLLKEKLSAYVAAEPYVSPLQANETPTL